MTAPYLYSVNDLGTNIKVAVYGTGEMGYHLGRELMIKRPDIKIVCFLDSFQRGEFLGRPIYHPFDLNRDAPDFDIVLVATILWADEVAQILEEAGPYPYTVSLLTPHKEAGFPSTEISRCRIHLEKVANILADSKDRELWSILMGVLETADNRPLARWFVEHRERPYHHRLSLPRNGVVVEGGVFDGTDTLAFAHAVGPSGNVYGFDPLGKSVVEARNRQAVLAHPAIELIPKALWSCTTTLQFRNHGAASTVGETLTQGGKKPNSYPVEAISVDDFVSARGLSRLDFIKLDVEGAEQHVLRGAHESIQKFRPSLAVSIYHSIEDMYNIPMMLNKSLQNYNFHVFAYSPNIGDFVLHAIPKAPRSQTPTRSN